jgi:Cu-Zn family superoxide dismutase
MKKAGGSALNAARALPLGLSVALLAGTALAEAPTAATAELRDASGGSLGVARLVEVAGGVHITGTVQGLPPGRHGLHVHAVGTCDGPAFASAGGHFNPTGKKHGLRGPEGAHAGDLPNLSAGADGTAAIDGVARGATLAAGASPLLDADGAALVIHAREDDEMTDPAGSSGDRIVCGVLAQQALGPAPSQLPRTGGLGAALPALAGLGLLLGGGALRRGRRREGRSGSQASDQTEL